MNNDVAHQQYSNRFFHVSSKVRSAKAPPVIVAVTKTWPFDVVSLGYASGFRHFGENRVEEGIQKIEEAKKAHMTDIAWHMIGHVQGRKVDDVARFFDWVDSIDSVAIAHKLNDAAIKMNKKLSILLEVNVSGEASKYGFDLAHWMYKSQKMKDFMLSVDDITRLSHLSVAGLMTMPPYVADAEENRALFKNVRILLEKICDAYPSFGRQLSMGTSCDYEVAIEEGATMVRLGEALFGRRA